ncbi:hypothetical protein TI03_00510 [Achromatium sp. WMS1]|nr:hypothetical protein TI03_00510 [Achromatium sp. WMS1]
MQSLTNEHATIPKDGEKEQIARIMRQGRLDDIPKISAIAAAYLNEATLDDKIIERWFNANPEILRVIECNHNPHTGKQEPHLCGYYILIPIDASFAELIKKDAIPHEDIPASAIKEYSDPTVSSVFFIDLMAHYPICKGKYCGQITAAHIVYDFACILNDFSNRCPHIQEIITMPMTRESKLLVKRFGLKKDHTFKSHPDWELWTIETSVLAKHAPDVIKKLSSKFQLFLDK